MRLSELLRMHVVDVEGVEAGHVHDVRLRQDGPMTSGFDAGLRVHGLVIGRGAVANRLGYGRSTRGPWLIRALLQIRDRSAFVPWNQIRAIDGDTIVLACTRDELESVGP